MLKQRERPRIDELKTYLESRLADSEKELAILMERVRTVEVTRTASKQILLEVGRLIAGRVAIEKDFCFLPKEAREHMIEIAEKAFWDKEVEGVFRDC